MNHKLTYYLLRGKHFELMREYIADLGKFLTVSLSIGSEVFKCKIMEAGLKIKGVGQVVEGPAYEAMRLMTVDQYSGKLIEGLSSREPLRIDDIELSQGVRRALLSTQIIDGKSCYFLNTTCEIEGISTDKTENLNLILDDQHTYNIVFKVAVPKSGKFQLDKEI